MKKVGIMDGDYVVVRPAQLAQDGEIVVALVGDDSEATVKRFFKQDDHVRLEPENDELEAIVSNEVSIVGSVVGVFRRVS